MFGYTMPIESALSEYATISFRNYYCETCHHLREEYGIITTLTVSYEMTFASLFLNSILKDGVELHYRHKRHFCVFRPSASKSELLHKLAGFSLLLANNSLVDDKMDNTASLKTNLALLGLNRGIEKAKREFPEYDEIINSGYEKLREAEAAGESDPIVAGQYSSQPMLDVFKVMMGDEFDDRMYEMFRQIGIWVYVLDAIEDLDDDKRDGTYNPFLVNNKDFKNKKEFVKSNIFYIGELVGGIIGGIQSAYASLRNDIKCNLEILDNIIFEGMPFSSQRVIKGEKVMTFSVKKMVTNRMNRVLLPPSMQ